MVTLKKIIRITARGIAYFFEFFLAFLVFYFILAVICSIIPVNSDSPKDGFGFFVKTNGVHTDICLPVETEFIDWKKFIPIVDYPNNKEFKYISFGWGDKGFFLDTPEWSDLTISTALNAALFPSPTAMHVVYLDHAPETGEDTKHVFMEKIKYPDLINYIKKSFKLQHGVSHLIPNRGYWDNDNFYEAKGSYHLFRTCNIWTNDALKIAGVRTALLGLFSDGIMRHLN